VDTNPLHHEFHTTIAKAELSVALLEEDGVVNANANCTPKAAQVRRISNLYTDQIVSHCSFSSIFRQIFVEMFSGGDSFKTFAARMRVRSGMT
jgi:hypothetical protein